MTGIFARNLRDKQVMSSDGITLGILNNIVIDVRTGDVIDLVVKPDIAIEKDKYITEDDFLLIPFNAVRAIKDYVVVDKTLARGQPVLEEPPAEPQ